MNKLTQTDVNARTTAVLELLSELSPRQKQTILKVALCWVVHSEDPQPRPRLQQIADSLVPWFDDQVAMAAYLG